MNPVGHLVVGPAEHGVVRFGRDLIAGLAGQGQVGVVVETGWSELRADPATVLAALRGSSLVHAQYTDRLFGPTGEESAALVERVAATLAEHGSRLSLTLHDLPATASEYPATDPTGRLHPDASAAAESLRRRRSDVYCRVAAASHGVVVCSRHEQGRLAALGADPRRAVVVPHPVPTPAPRPSTIPPVRDVTVLGFLYPGKGHAEVLRAMPGLPTTYPLTVLGRPSDGHDDLIDSLRAMATSAGRALHVTGFVPDADLPAALQHAGVPVAPHRQVSASGSIATWLGGGRRPLVPDVPYTRELAERCPGAVWCYDDEADLAAALRAAVADPALTWLDGEPVGPSPAQVAVAYAQRLAAWS